INLLPILFCVAWLPLTCLFVRKLTLQPTPRRFALSVLVLGLQMLAAEPTTIAQTLLILGCYGCFRAWISRRLRPLAAIAGVIAVSITLAAVQIVPAIDHVRHSSRSRPIPLEAVAAWSMPWAKLLELV